LGLAASLIEVIMPVITVVTVIVFIWAIFAANPITSSGSSPAIPSFPSTFFGFGAVFALVGIVTFVGIILFIVAMHRLSQYYVEPGIFKNALYGFILNVVGSATVIAIEFVFILRSMANISQTGTVPTAATPTQTTPAVISVLSQLIIGFLVVLAIAVVLGIIRAVFFMRAFNKLAEKSGKDNFKTAGLLYLLGTVLTIVLIGGILIWIAWILAAMGFNSLKPKESLTPTLPYPPL